MDSIIGRKVGMTQVFDANANQIPVTVLEAGPCPVVQRRTAEKDRVEAVQIGFVDCSGKNQGKALRTHFEKAKVAPKRVLREVRLETGDDFKVGDTLTVALFKDSKFVDVTGVTKGRGFQGVVKRHGFAGGDSTHGSSKFHRRSGAIGMRNFPGRVLKGHRMGGHMGNTQATASNLEVVQVREQDNLILVKGAVPGPNGGIVMIRKAVKKKGVKKS
jgi:large subunit ribosomal protein L3